MMRVPPSDSRRLRFLAALVLLLPAPGCQNHAASSQGAPVPASANKITVAAASSLAGVLPKIREQFLAKNPGAEVEIIFGSSGAFYAQITNGAPFDLFLSADTMYPQKLLQQRRAEHYRVYAQGQVVLWVLRDSPLEVERGLEVLLSPRVQRVSLANPATAPYGKAAVEALQHQGIYEQVASKLVRGESVAHAAQMVQSGAADCGLIALSLAVSPRLKNQGRWYTLPQEAYRPIRQALVIPAHSPNKELARRFAQFLFTPQARELFRQFGFADPEETP